MGMSLAMMCAYFGQVAVWPDRRQALHLIHMKGSILPRSRKDAVKSALKLKADYLLFVDSDQGFPRDTLHRLMRHKKAIVGANVATKTIPANPTARLKPGPNDPGYGTLCYTDPNSTGLEKVWRIGCGVTLFSMAVFHQVGIKHFGMMWKDEMEDYQGEDWTLMEEVERRGIEIYVDHDLSKEVIHYGWFEYTHEMVGRVVTQEEMPLVDIA
jgi:hypothetical protein